MGSGTGLASGFAKLGRFGMDQSVVAVCGDSTFFHAVLPALANAVHHESDFTLVVLDNSGTAMTGFQPHPGMDAGAGGEPALGLDIGGICRAMGAEVAVSDPFDLDGTQQLLLEMLNPKAGVRVLILRQSCALSPERRHAPRFAMQVAEDLCIGEECGCNRLCTRVFKCPGLYWDDAAGTAGIDEALCAGCGVCAEICPSGAITRKEVA
jgi:indolepyruvate ferredoxin oxidoreductase alpha subunit